MSAILEVKDLSISFGGVHALQSVSFSLEKGEVLGLIGPNGSGKSTCVNIISGVYKADAGEVWFDGKLIKTDEDIHKRARLGFGRTFQTPKPFGNISVYQNIFSIALLKYSMKAAAEKTEEILELTKLMPLKDMLSAKLPIEKRKWLDLARILSTDPKLIMMDEVMAGLNITEMEDSLALVREINSHGISILFIEHVMRAVVSICNKVVVLNEGCLIGEGEPAEVLHRPEIIAAYIGGKKCSN